MAEPHLHHQIVLVMVERAVNQGAGTIIQEEITGYRFLQQILRIMKHMKPDPLHHTRDASGVIP